MNQFIRTNALLGALLISVGMAAVSPASADVHIIPRGPVKLVKHTSAPQHIRKQYKEVLLEGALVELDRDGKDAFEFLTVHTTTIPKSPADIKEAMKELQLMVQRGYAPNPTTYSYMADVPYHYLISRDGKVAEGRKITFPARTNTPKSKYGQNIKKHLTVVLQDAFVLGPDGKPVRPLQIAAPTEAQYSTLEDLLHQLARERNIKIENVGYHSQYAKSSCPGPHVIDRFPRIIANLRNRGV